MSGNRDRGRVWWRGSLLSVGAIVGMVALAQPLTGQSCTTQAAMTPEVRNALANKALELATAVVGSDAARVQSETIAEFATNFTATADLVRSTGAQLQGDILRVTHLYELDAANRKAGDASVAEFTCPLVGTTAETDLAIPGLPPGTYAFAMVEANGPSPWLLTFLLQQEGGQWKMAGFYPRARTAAGHDGLWYWRAAREDAKNKELWLAWLIYGEAEQLLRPANFVSSTNLDLLETERRTAVPPELSDGIGAETPLVVKGTAAAAGSASGPAEYRFTALGTEGSEDGNGLNLMLHLELEPGSDPAAPNAAAAKARNIAAAAALLDAHKELRQAFANVWVFAESAAHDTFATEQKLAEIP